MLERKLEFLGKSWCDFENGRFGDKGCGSIRIRAALIGHDGAITWTASLGWYLPETFEAWKQKGIAPRHENQGQGYAVCVHSPTPIYGNEDNEGECDVLPGGKCFGDCGYLAGEEFFNITMRGGEAALWAKMLEWYDDHFGEQEKEER